MGSRAAKRQWAYGKWRSCMDDARELRVRLNGPEGAPQRDCSAEVRGYSAEGQEQAFCFHLHPANRPEFAALVAPEMDKAGREMADLLKDLCTCAQAHCRHCSARRAWWDAVSRF